MDDLVEESNSFAIVLHIQKSLVKKCGFIAYNCRLFLSSSTCQCSINGASLVAKLSTFSGEKLLPSRPYLQHVVLNFSDMLFPKNENVCLFIFRKVFLFSMFNILIKI